MSYTEIAALLSDIAEMTEAQTLDDAVATDWFKVAQQVNNLAAAAKAQVEQDLDEHYEQMCREHDDYSDALYDSISAGWGWD